MDSKASPSWQQQALYITRETHHSDMSRKPVSFFGGGELLVLARLVEELPPEGLETLCLWNAPKYREYLDEIRDGANEAMAADNRKQHAKK
jgi:hypothetical protein